MEINNNLLKVKYNNGLAMYDGKINICIGIILLLCVATKNYMFSSFISVIVMVFFFVWLLLNHSIIYFKYLHFIFGSVAAITGCIIIEFSKNFLSELVTWTKFTGALPLLVFSWWILLTTITYSDTWIMKRQDTVEKRRVINVKNYFHANNINDNKVAYIAALVGFLLIVFVFLVVFKNPSFKLGMDRFQYAKEFDYGFIYNKALRLIDYLLIPIVVIAIYKKNKMAWLALVIYCCYAFWVGNKFGIFFSLLCMFGMIYSNKLSDRFEELGKGIVSFLLLILILIGVAVFAVSFTQVKGSSDYLLQRSAQQAQLWWKTYSTSDRNHLFEFGDEIESIISGDGDICKNVGADYGIYKIMYYATPHTVVNQKIASGSRYTEAGFAAAYYYGGLLGCIIFAVLGGLLSSLCVNSFLFYLKYNQFIRAFIYYRFYTYTLVFVSMFTFFPFFNKTSIICYIILIACNRKIFKYESQQI